MGGLLSFKKQSWVTPEQQKKVFEVLSSQAPIFGAENDHQLRHDPTAMGAVNHSSGLMATKFIHQTSFPVSLGIKDSMVRAYRTDPAQLNDELKKMDEQLKKGKRKTELSSPS